MVSHSTTQKPDLANQPSNTMPDMVTPDLAVPASLANDVIHLQRLIGNRATTQLIASKKAALGTLNRSVSNGGPIIQRVMSAEAFKESTAQGMLSSRGAELVLYRQKPGNTGILRKNYEHK